MPNSDNLKIVVWIETQHKELEVIGEVDWHQGRPRIKAIDLVASSIIREQIEIGLSGGVHESLCAAFGDGGHELFTSEKLEPGDPRFFQVLAEEFAPWRLQFRGKPVHAWVAQRLLDFEKPPRVNRPVLTEFVT